MKNLKYLILFLLISCKYERELKILNKNNIPYTVTVEKKQIIKEDTILESSVPRENEIIKEGCATPGLCLKCGLTLKGKHECSASFWRNCPGTQDVSYKTSLDTYHKEYLVKEKTGQINKYIGITESYIKRIPIMYSACIKN